MKSVSLGAVGFGLGQCLAWGTIGAFNPLVQDFRVGHWIGTLLAALVGAIGGATLGTAHSPPKKLGRFALAGAIGQGLGFYLMTLFFSVYIEPRISGCAAFTIAYSIQYAIIGALTGALLGDVQAERGQTGRLALAGGIGFGLGWLIFELVSHLVGRISIDVPNSLLLALNAGVSGVMLGAVGGAFLGFTWERR